MEPDLAHSFGLFCDIGIPVLLPRFESPSYRVTLAEANLGHRPFTDVEFARHGTHHALVGATMAASWGLSDEIVQALALHHDYRCLGSKDVPERVQVLVALTLLAELIIQRSIPGPSRPRDCRAACPWGPPAACWRCWPNASSSAITD